METLRGGEHLVCPQVPVEDRPGKAIVALTASTLSDELAVGGQRLLAASGQVPMAAHNSPRSGCVGAKEAVPAPTRCLSFSANQLQARSA